MNKQLLQDDRMNLGRRIEKRLSDLQWSRQKLFDAIPGLSPQALSNLIRRDSKRSEWDEAISEALGVSVAWLVYGKDISYTRDENGSPGAINEPKAEVYPFLGEPVKEVVEIMNQLPNERQREILEFSRERLVLHQLDSQNSMARGGK